MRVYPAEESMFTDHRCVCVCVSQGGRRRVSTDSGWAFPSGGCFIIKVEVSTLTVNEEQKRPQHKNNMMLKGAGVSMVTHRRGGGCRGNHGNSERRGVTVLSSAVGQFNI